MLSSDLGALWNNQRSSVLFYHDDCNFVDEVVASLKGIRYAILWCKERDIERVEAID